MNKKIYLTFILSFLLLLPLSTHAAAVVKGEIPKVEPLQSLPQSIKPNYDHNVQSGEFETTSFTQQQDVAQQEAPVPAAKVKSSSSNFLFYLIIILILMIPVCYFSWKKIKQKQ